MRRITVLLSVALMLAMGAGPAMAERIYRAMKPHWWKSPAMKCFPPTSDEWYWCGAGGWQISKLSALGESIAAWGDAAYHPESGVATLSIRTAFLHEEVAFTCSGQSEPLEVQRARVKSQETVPVYEYLTWASRARIEACLEKPIKMTVDGRTFRLDTKLLRQALTNAVDRATY